MLPMQTSRRWRTDRRATRPTHEPAIQAVAPAEHTVCPRCRAVFVHKSWRRSDRRLVTALLRDAPLRPCPACVQVQHGVGWGRLLVRGSFTAEEEREVRARIEHVADRAARREPEKRVVDVARVALGLEVLTTSQKLAHRLGRELAKAFGGRTVYAWSDRDGGLYAEWTRQAR